MTKINHWKVYTNQPSTPMVSQEAGGQQALMMATSDQILTYLTNGGGHLVLSFTMSVNK